MRCQIRKYDNSAIEEEIKKRGRDPAKVVNRIVFSSRRRDLLTRTGITKEVMYTEFFGFTSCGILGKASPIYGIDGMIDSGAGRTPEKGTTFCSLGEAVVFTSDDWSQEYLPLDYADILRMMNEVNFKLALEKI